MSSSEIMRELKADKYANMYKRILDAVYNSGFVVVRSKDTDDGFVLNIFLIRSCIEHNKHIVDFNVTVEEPYKLIQDIRNNMESINIDDLDITDYAYDEDMRSMCLTYKDVEECINSCITALNLIEENFDIINRADDKGRKVRQYYCNRSSWDEAPDCDYCQLREVCIEYSNEVDDIAVHNVQCDIKWAKKVNELFGGE